MNGDAVGDVVSKKTRSTIISLDTDMRDTLERSMNHRAHDRGVFSSEHLLVFTKQGTNEASSA